MIHDTQLTFIEPCSTVPGQGCDLNCLAVGLSMDFEVSFSPFHRMWFRAVLTWQTHHRLQLLFTVMKVSQRSGDRGDIISQTLLQPSFTYVSRSSGSEASGKKFISM